MSKKLVAYFSVSNITKKLASKIAETADADLFEIAPQTPYTEADVNWKNPLARCTKEKVGKKDVPIASKVEGFGEYDTVYLGFPIWYWNAPNIVLSFLKQYDFSGKTIVLFATSGGSNLGKTTQTVADIVGSNVTVKDGLVINDMSDEKIGELLRL